MSDNLKTWPDRIWLQHSEDGYPVPAYKVETDEITWCEDKQYDCDIEYARADRITELERQLAKLTDDFTRQLDTLSSRNYELRMKNAGLERQLAELRSQPTDIVQRLNTALGEAFKEDPANAVRAHAAVLPLFLSQPTAQQVEDARDAARYRYWRDKWRSRYSFQDPLISSQQLDSTIDAAMQAGKEPKECGS